MLSKDITLVRTAIGICLYTSISCCFLAAVAALVQRWHNLTGRFVWFRENLHVSSLRCFLPVCLQRPRNRKGSDRALAQVLTMRREKEALERFCTHPEERRWPKDNQRRAA
jgi:hypothetical protein